VEPRNQPLRAESGQTVLLVEDEPSVRRLLVMVMQGLGYTVIGAAEVGYALHLLEGMQRIDLLVTDMGLDDGLNGRQLADAGRALRPDLKVLFITGYAGATASNLAPGMELMTKPFTMAAFSARVGGMIRQP
jgi:CheY-like chemotaxis protein